MGKGVKVDCRKQRGIETALPERGTSPTAYPTASLLAAEPGKRIQDVVDTTGGILPQHGTVAQVVSTRWTWRSSETGGRAPGQGQKALSKPAAAKSAGGQGATGPVPDGLGCKGVGLGRWGVRYTYKGMYSLMKGLGLGLKVPRPHSDKADAKQQMAWKKGPTGCLGPGWNDYCLPVMAL